MGIRTLYADHTELLKSLETSNPRITKKQLLASVCEHVDILRSQSLPSFSGTPNCEKVDSEPFKLNLQHQIVNLTLRLDTLEKWQQRDKQQIWANELKQDALASMVQDLIDTVSGTRSEVGD